MAVYITRHLSQLFMPAGLDSLLRRALSSRLAFVARPSHNVPALQSRSSGSDRQTRILVCSSATHEIRGSSRTMPAFRDRRHSFLSTAAVRMQPSGICPSAPRARECRSRGPRIRVSTEILLDVNQSFVGPFQLRDVSKITRYQWYSDRRMFFPPESHFSKR